MLQLLTLLLESLLLVLLILLQLLVFPLYSHLYGFVICANFLCVVCERFGLRLKVIFLTIRLIVLRLEVFVKAFKIPLRIVKDSNFVGQFLIGFCHVQFPLVFYFNASPRKSIVLAFSSLDFSMSRCSLVFCVKTNCRGHQFSAPFSHRLLSCLDVPRSSASTNRRGQHWLSWCPDFLWSSASTHSRGQ